MAPAMATARLRKELVKLQKEPPPGIIAEPDESNILKWHYAVRGPPDTPFDGGIYVGKLVFPTEYPMKPPGIMMLTPSGRFQVNTRLCLSMSDFHPESWNPMWSVATILQGVQSFMASDELTTGAVKAPESERKKLAGLSIAYNQKMFANFFGGKNIASAVEEADKASKEAEEAAARANTSGNNSTNNRVSRRGRMRAARNKQKEEQDDDNDNNDEDQDEEESEAKNDDKPNKDLSQDEIEKRRKKNAKKRAKQKGKKAAQQKISTTDEAQDEGDD